MKLYSYLVPTALGLTIVGSSFMLGYNEPLRGNSRAVFEDLNAPGIAALVQSPPANMNAFPTAEGFGATALWGDDGDTTTANRTCDHSNTLVHVFDDLSGSGPGTLDSIITNELRADTVDVVVANVSGEYSGGNITIEDKSCVLIALWTAPEPGIDLDNRITIAGDTTLTHDIVILGQKSSPDGTNGIPGASPLVIAGSRIIVSQFTTRGCNNDCAEVFADDGFANADLPIRNVTFSRFIIGPGVDAARGIGCRADDQDIDRTGIYRCDVHSGIVAHTQNRMPLTTARTPNVDSGIVVANIAAYNGDFAMVESKDTLHIDLRGLCVVRGPMTDANHLIAYDTQDGGSTFYNQAHIYIDEADTASAGGSNPCSGGAPSDQWSVLQYSQSPYAELDTAKYGQGRTGPQPSPQFPISLLAVEDIWPTIVAVAPALGNELALTDIVVGAGIRVGPDGKRYAFRGDIDSTLVNDARTNGGPSVMYDSTQAYGPDDTNLGSGSAWTDADGDGLPDDFEVRICGAADSTCAAPEGDEDGDLYSNAIEYAVGSDPTVFTATDGTESDPVDYTTLTNGIDTLYAYLGTPDPADTPTTYHPRWDTFPAPRGSPYWCYKSDLSELVLITSPDSITGAGVAWLSETTLDSILDDWGVAGCSLEDVQNRDPATGEPIS